MRLWDQRKKEEVNCLTPGEQSTLARPHLGKHISCAAVSSDWLVCGGGPRLAHGKSAAQGLELDPRAQVRFAARSRVRVSEVAFFSFQEKIKAVPDVTDLLSHCRGSLGREIRASFRE